MGTHVPPLSPRTNHNTNIRSYSLVFIGIKIIEQLLLTYSYFRTSFIFRSYLKKFQKITYVQNSPQLPALLWGLEVVHRNCMMNHFARKAKLITLSALYFCQFDFTNQNIVKNVISDIKFTVSEQRWFLGNEQLRNFLSRIVYI